MPPKRKRANSIQDMGVKNSTTAGTNPNARRAKGRGQDMDGTMNGRGSDNVINNKRWEARKRAWMECEYRRVDEFW